jgi:hypothetical protein
VTSGPADLGWLAGGFHDTFYFHRVARHDVDISGFEELEASTYLEHRWWPAAEPAQTADQVVPNGLVPLLRDLLAGIRPPEPVRLPWHH